MDFTNKAPVPGSKGKGSSLFCNIEIFESETNTKILPLLLKQCIFPIPFSLSNLYSRV